MSGIFEHALNLQENNIEYLDRRFYETDDTQDIVEALADRDQIDWLLDMDEKEFNEGC